MPMLTEHQVDWQPCAYVADEHSMASYDGQLYLDVPYDDNDPLYVQMRNYWENPDGTMRFDTVSFWYLPLEKPWRWLTSMNPAFGEMSGRFLTG